MGAYRTFTKSGNIRISITVVYFSILFLFFISIPLVVKWIHFLFIMLIIIILILTGWIIKFFTFSTQAKFHGEFDGTLEFYDDKIVVRGVEYPISTIRKMQFDVTDYAGKSGYIVTLDPDLSNGTDNYLVLTLKSQEKVKVFFQLQSKLHFKQEKEALISYHKHDKISFLRLIELLRIKKYEDIQEFKKSL